MDRLDAMQTFIRAAELGSFAAVAQQLGLARSVVTRQIASLERQLGARLFARSTRRLSLTSSGIAYLERCREILRLVESAEAEVAEERAVARGSLRVGLPLIYGLRTLAPLLMSFAEQHPAVTLGMDYTDRRLDLIEEGFDLAIRVTSRLAPSDVVRRLGSCRLLLLASPGYLARRGRPTHPAELAGHDCLTYSGDQPQNTWPFTVAGEVVRFPIRSRLDSNHGEVLLDAAARGLGLTLQPDFIAEAGLADGRVVQLLESFAPPPLGVYAVLPAGRQMTYRARLLLEHLASALA